MATRVIKTRIQNKLDTLAEWSTENPKLLYGEIATVSTTKQKIDLETGVISEVPTYLIKIGDGINSFNSLPWLSAEAIDVFDWAKEEKAEDIRVAITNGTESVTKTLAEWLQSINTAQAIQDSAIATNTAKLAGHTDEAINTLIISKIATLDHTSEGSGDIVTKVEQLDGKVKVTYGNLTESNIPNIHANKVIVTDATSSSGQVTLDTKLNTLASDILSINTVIAGGVHFIGITSTDFSQAANLANRTINIKNSDGTTKTYTANTGDIVIQDSTTKEFIWTSSAWQELGDQSRIGALESKVNAMDLADSPVTSKYITAVSQTDGKISISRKQPESYEIAHTSTATVSQVLNDLTGKLTGINTTVTEAISTAIGALDVSEPAASGNATAFIDTLKQTDGKIIATKKTLPDATTSAKGIVKLNDNTNSTSTIEAATANAVKKAYDVAAAIGGNYIRVGSSDSKMYVGTNGLDEIIFDCGGPPVV